MNAKRKSRLTVRAVLVGLLALLGYVVRSELAYARLKDPTRFTTITDFYSRFGTSTNTTAMTIGGTEYLQLTGPLPPKWSLAMPSSPPVYIFDDAGRFVDWCSDSGDMPSWHQKWPTTDGLSLTDLEVRTRFEIDQS